MAAPQFQLAISQKLLQKIVAEVLPSLLTVDNPTDADGSNPKDPNPQWVTEFEITEVVPLRADDTANMDVTGAVNASGVSGPVSAQVGLKQIRGAIQDAIKNGNLKLPKTFDLESQRTYVSNTPGLQPITVPATFLLVSCTYRQVSSDDLHTNHTSDFQPPTIFKRGTGLTNAILLQLDVAPRSSGLSLSVQLVGVLDVQGALLTLAILQGINPAFVATQGTTIPLDNMVGQLPGLNGLINVGITTAPWADASTPPALGVRIGFDLMVPDDISGWTNFHTSSPTWEADALGGMNDVSIVADAGMPTCRLSLPLRSLRRTF